VLYIIIALLCWLMVSGVKFIKMIPSKWALKYSWPQLTLVALSAIAIPFLQIAVVPFAFVLYVLLSFIYKQPEVVEQKN
jgi:CDP-diacylglycerol--serine O-phosphatidyltransferase